MAYLENIDTSIFKAYDIRGIYPSQLDESLASLIAQSYLKIVSEKLGQDIKGLKILVCRDNRVASEPLMKEVIKIFLEYGVDIYDMGLMSINDYYFAMGHYKYDGGILATASHNPPEYGGFKMTVKDTKIQNSVGFISGKDLYSKLQDLDFPISDPKVKGNITEINIEDNLLKHLFSFVDVKNIKPLKVVVDTGNGAMGIMIPKIFAKLPCEFIHLFGELDSNFPNRAPNPLTKGSPDKLAARVRETKADLGVIFDVDGDRMFLVDEKGNFYRGDMVGCVMAKPMLEKNPGAGIVYNLICTHAVPDLIKKWGGRPIRSEVGFKNMARHMREENGIMGIETSAHFSFKDNYYTDSGYLAMLLSIETISKDGRPLSEIMEDFKLYEKYPETNFVVDNVDIELAKFREHYKKNILDEIDGITVEFKDWWFNVRPSNTEPLLRLNVEAKDKNILTAKVKELEGLIDFTERKQ